ncbi:MAG: DGQHR domain-containing protein [Acidobacteriota bacterium]|nr:DGQHR domain-containing protein [Acidobacteriota bacterium]
MKKRSELRLPAIEVRQGRDRVLYSFAVDGKLINSFATVSRIRRTDGRQLDGYQRPEVLSHISEIRNYVESESPMIPNAVVIAFDSRVTFEPAPDLNGAAGYSRAGTLAIPVDPALDPEDRPGFIVDGQQRVAAIRDARVESFPICVTAFITSDVKEQTEQFILVNSTKPLPKGLIYELLPGTESALPSLLQRRRFPAYLLDLLNHEERSPLRGLIQTPTTPGGVIKDNSILKMLENSLSDGVLYRYRYVQDGPGDVDSMLDVLTSFWGAVSEVFDSAWKLPPRHSRLMHGAGIVSMGFLMDAISERYRRTRVPTREHFTNDLLPLKEICSWTNGYWDFGPGRQRKWNEIQNTTKDIQLLANYLLVQYKSLVWNREAGPSNGAGLSQPAMFN